MTNIEVHLFRLKCVTLGNQCNHPSQYARLHGSIKPEDGGAGRSPRPKPLYYFTLSCVAQTVEAFFNRFFKRILKANLGKTRDNLTLERILGGSSLLGDFLAEVVTPVLLSALIDMEHTAVDDLGLHESVVCLAMRRARKWINLTSGGFGTRTLKAFQDGLWYYVFQFVTGPRRFAHGLKTLARSDFSNPKIVQFVAPYARAEGEGGGDDDGGAGAGAAGGGAASPGLVVEETAPPADYNGSGNESWTSSFLEELI
ncbi:unnamed protein product [Pylaiella littoralis]